MRLFLWHRIGCTRNCSKTMKEETVNEEKWFFCLLKWSLFPKWGLYIQNVSQIMLFLSQALCFTPCPSEQPQSPPLSSPLPRPLHSLCSNHSGLWLLLGQAKPALTWALAFAWPVPWLGLLPLDSPGRNTWLLCFILLQMSPWQWGSPNVLI